MEDSQNKFNSSRQRRKKIVVHGGGGGGGIGGVVLLLGGAAFAAAAIVSSINSSRRKPIAKNSTKPQHRNQVQKFKHQSSCGDDDSGRDEERNEGLRYLLQISYPSAETHRCCSSSSVGNGAVKVGSVQIDSSELTSIPEEQLAVESNVAEKSLNSRVQEIVSDEDDDTKADNLVEKACDYDVVEEEVDNNEDIHACDVVEEQVHIDEENNAEVPILEENVQVTEEAKVSQVTEVETVLEEEQLELKEMETSHIQISEEQILTEASKAIEQVQRIWEHGGRRILNTVNDAASLMMVHSPLSPVPTKTSSRFWLTLAFALFLAVVQRLLMSSPLLSS